MRATIVLLVILLPTLAAAQTAVDEAAAVVSRAASPIDAAPVFRTRSQHALSDLLSPLSPHTAFDGACQVSASSRPVGDEFETLIDIACANVTWRDVDLGELEMRIWEPAVGDTPAFYRLALRGAVEVDATGALAERWNGGWSAESARSTVEAVVRIVDIADLAEPLGVPLGSKKIVATVEGALDNLTVALDADTITWRNHPLGPMKARVVQQQERVQLHLDWADHATVRADVPVALQAGLWEWDTAQPIDVQIKVTGVTPDVLRPWTRPLRGVSYALGGEMQITGTLENPEIRSELTGQLAAPGADAPFRLAVSGDGQTQQWDLKWGEFLEAGARTQLSVGRAADGQIDARVRANIPLLAFTPFARWMAQPRGMMAADVRIAGSANQPQLSGRVDLEQVSFTLVPARRRLTLDRSAIAVAGDEIRFDGRLKSAPGLAKVVSTTRLRLAEAALQTTAKVHLARFPIVHPDFPVSLLTTNLEVEHEMRLSDSALEVRATGSHIQVLDEHLPQTSTIPSNDDISFVDDQNDEATGRSNYEVRLVLQEPMRVAGGGTDVMLLGELAVQRRGDIVNVDGGFRANPGGEFRLFDNRFIVRDGLLTIQPGNVRRRLTMDDTGLREPAPTDPVVSLVADHTSEDTWVVVRIDGAMKRPSLTLRSLPALPEYQILTLLITGRVDTVDERSGNVRRAVARMVDRYHNPSLERQLFDRIGVDKVGLGFRSSVTNPVLTVGKQITKTLYVETIYRHSAPPDLNMVEGHVEKRFGRRWTIDTVFGDAAEGTFGGYWRTSFGGPPRPKPTDDDLKLRLDPALVADDDEDGVSNVYDLCADLAEDVDGYRDEDGCPENDNDGDGIIDSADAAPNQPETFNGYEDADGRPDEPPQAAINVRYEIRALLFASNSARLTDAHRRSLRHIASRLADSDSRLVVEGHSDSAGSERTNTRVSRDRARAVVRELTRLGLRRQNIELRVFGAEQPVDADGESERNRRVAIRIVAGP